MSLTIFASDSTTFFSRTVLSCWIVARISLTLLRRTSTSRHKKDYTMSQTVRDITTVHQDRRSPPSTRSGNGTWCASTVFCVCVVRTWRFISSMSTIVFMYHIRAASTVFCTFLLIGTCCIHHLIRNCTCENSAVFFLDRLSTLDCCYQRRRSDHSFHCRLIPSQTLGLVLASHVPHDGTRVLASLKPTVGTVITTSPDCESTTWIVLSSAASSQDSRWSRVTMLLALARRLSSFCTRLLDLRSVMRFFSFTSCRSALHACCWLCSFLACCWLCSFLVAYVHHPSLVDLRPAPAPVRSL